MSEFDYLVEFSAFLKSSEVKYRFEKEHLLNPYSYNREIINFFTFWCTSNYFTPNYKSVHEKREFSTNPNVDIEVLLADITYMIRRERFSPGVVATQLDTFERLIDWVIEKELHRS